MAFNPPLPPPLPTWPPFLDDDRSSMHTILHPPPPPPPMPPLPHTHDPVPSFRSLSVIRNCDDNLRRMNTSATPPGFDVEPSMPRTPTFDLTSAWGTTSAFGATPLTTTRVTTTSNDWVLSPVEIEHKAVAILVDKTFGTDAKVNGALVEWLDDPVLRWHVASCFLNLRRDVIVFRDGTAFQNDYDLLIARLGAYFMGRELAVHTSEKALVTFLLQRIALTKGDDYFVKRFMWACDGVRVVGEAASRTGNLGLSDDEVRDLCTCIRSLATALPPLSRQLQAAERVAHLTESIGSLTVSAATSRSTTPTTSPVVSPTLSFKKDITKQEQSMAAPPSSWATVITTPSVKQPGMTQPTRETDESLHFFDEAPELDGMKRVQVFRLKRHCSMQPKANLCPLEVSSAPDHNPQTCQYSHSVLEVMTYSPLYKLFVCNDDSHYGEDAHERGDCAFLHVDVGFKTEWMDDFAKGKRSYCTSGVKCTNKSCLKSHSFAEMCWYNPWYKIQRCDRACPEPSLVCRYFHEGSGDRRYLELDDDHVGHAIEIPFVSRTHDALIKKLKAIGL